MATRVVIATRVVVATRVVIATRIIRTSRIVIEEPVGRIGIASQIVVLLEQIANIGDLVGL